MNSKTPPFYANRDDNKSCSLACLMMALEHITGKRYSWSELENLSGFEDGKAAWTIQAWQALASQGIDINMSENFDYQKYFDQGEEYLKGFFTTEELEWQLKNSNLLSIKPLILSFLQSVSYNQVIPDLKTIDSLLKSGYLVTVQLNSNILNDTPGYTAHMILVFDKEGDDYIAHDPGLPPKASRRIAGDKLFLAMGGKENTVEVTGLKGKNE